MSEVAPGEYWYDGKLYCVGFPKSTLDKIKNEFIAADDDIILATYPKSGTIWMQEIIYLIQSNGDTESASTIPMQDRFPFLEEVKTPLTRDVLFEDGFTVIQEKSSKRLIKTHLGPSFYSKTLKEKKTKFVVMSRNIKDVLVSYYHFYKKIPLLGSFQGSWDDFFELYKNKRLIHGDWFDFESSWWNEHRNNQNVHFVHFEDMKKNLKQEMNKLCKFLNTDLSEETIDKIIDYVTFDNMKGTITGKDLRSGSSGGWRSYFSKDQNDYVDKLYADIIVPIDLEFDFSL